jgi:type I restriction enzyme S subunit
MSELKELPNDWRWVKLAEICSRIDYGFTASANFSISTPKFLRITDIQNGYVNWETVPGCEISLVEEEANKLCDGDIVFARTGGTVGKSFLIQNPPRGVFASYLIRLRLIEGILPDYVYTFLQSDSYWQQIKASAQGGAQPNVNANLLGAIILPLAALSEQKAIASRFKRQMEETERMRRIAERQLEAAKAIRDSIFREAFTDLEIQGISIVTVDEVTSLVIDGPHVTPTYVKQGIPFVTVQNIRNRNLSFDNLQYISLQDHEEFTRRGKAEVGDILMTKDGTLGIPCLVDDAREFSFFVSVALIKPIRDRIDSEYFFYALDSPLVQSRIDEQSAGAGLKHIVLEEIKALEIPLPETKEDQIEFAQSLRCRIEKLAPIIATAEKQLEAINALPKAFLREVFGIFEPPELDERPDIDDEAEEWEEEDEQED